MRIPTIVVFLESLPHLLRIHFTEPLDFQLLQVVLYRAEGTISGGTGHLVVDVGEAARVVSCKFLRPVGRESLLTKPQLIRIVLGQVSAGREALVA